MTFVGEIECDFTCRCERMYAVVVGHDKERQVVTVYRRFGEKTDVPTARAEGDDPK